MDKRTNKLFEWAITNTSPSTDEKQPPSTRLDPNIINAILGPDDSQLMLESMTAIKDTSLPLDDRYVPPKPLLTTVSPPSTI
jgi:hypothetical protein